MTTMTIRAGPLGVALATLLLALPTTGALLSTASAPLATDRIDASLWQSALAAPTTAMPTFATLDHAVAPADLAALRGAGMTVLRAFPDFHLAFGLATRGSMLRVAAMPGVLHLQGNDALQLYGNTATISTRARESWDAKSTSTNPTGYDGSGVGVAIVDSGIDATHPDLANRVVANLKYVCTTPGLTSTATNQCYGNTVLIGTGCADPSTWEPLADTDSSSGHGTHVAGIVAGDGTMSSGRIMGAAPGASLVGLGTGEGLSILFAVEAFQWILCNHATYNIRIASNSWGPSAGPYVATDPVNVAANALVSAGITVFFAAGNDGATGANSMNPYARNPTPGVISVASTYDGDNGARSGSTVSSFSSRCLSTDSADDCPDVAAPGENILSTQAKTGPAVLALGAGRTLSYLPYYSAIDGTSMATPHAAGVAALLLQADSTLTPAQVEDALEDNAVQFEPAATYSITDAANPTTSVSPNSGHGLVDAIASLEDVLATTGLGSPQPQVSQNPHVYTGAAGAGLDAQVVGGVQWTLPSGTTATLSERSLTAGDAAWAMTAGTTPCQFVVFTPAAGSTTLACSGAGGKMTADTAPAVQMNADYTFAGSGTYTIEPQVDFGSGYVAIDSFTVAVV
jgi:serine protease AprX